MVRAALPRRDPIPPSGGSTAGIDGACSGTVSDGGSTIDTTAAHPTPGEEAAASSLSVSAVKAERLRVTACGSAALLLLSGGVDAVSISAVHGATSITKARLYRMFPNRDGLIAEVHREGHARVRALCDRGGGYGPRSGLEAVIALSYDLIEQAVSDPVVRAAYWMEVSQFATESSVPSVYEVWTARLTELIGPEVPDPGNDAQTDSSDHDGAGGDTTEESIALLVSALAGLCVSPSDQSAPFGVCGVEAGTSTATRLYVVLRSILPVLCADAEEVRFIDAYLRRIHTHTVDTGQ